MEGATPAALLLSDTELVAAQAESKMFSCFCNLAFGCFLVSLQ